MLVYSGFYKITFLRLLKFSQRLKRAKDPLISYTQSILKGRYIENLTERVQF